MALIILVFYLVIFLFQISYHNLTGREGIIRAYLITFGVTAIITELLSVFDLVTIWGVFISWFSVTAVLAFVLFKKLKADNWKFPYKGKIVKFPGLKDYSKAEFLVILVILCILLITFIIAVFSPPNNFDSMTYHMARVMHWIQQESVKFYPTSIPRQNYSMPMAEYQILHLQLLSQSDKFANLVQWTGFVMLIVMASEFTKLLQGSRKGQLLASLFAATIPMAILQSSNTQNDILVGVFSLIFAYFFLKTIKSNSWIDACFGGLALGLALLTKGTGYIFCAAVGLVYGFVGLIRHPRDTRLRLIKNFSIMIFFAFILNVGFFQRNLKLYGNPLSTEIGKLTIDRLYLRGVYSNLIRNGSIHLAVPVPILNERFSEVVKDHLGDSVSDQDTTFPGASFQIRFVINDDESGNPIHLLLILISIFLVIISRKQKDLNLYPHIGAIILSIFLFSLILKWQPWGSRLQLPIFMFGAPLVGYYFDRVNQSKVINLVVSLSLIFYCIPFIFLNSTRPLVPIFPSESPLRSNQVKRFFSNRPKLYSEFSEIIAPFYKDLSILNSDRQVLYFSSTMGIYEDYLTVTDFIRGIDEEYIGLDLGGNDMEYPIWVFVKRFDFERIPIFIHVGIEDISQRLIEKSDFYPDYIISTKFSPWGWLTENGYEVIVDTPSIDLYHRP